MSRLSRVLTKISGKKERRQPGYEKGHVQDLFRGPASLTYPGERGAFVLTLLLALPAAALIGYFIHEEVGISQVALFLVIAMIYVTLARGRLVGSSVRVHQSQYPHIFAIVSRAAAALEIPMPAIFVRDDNFVPVVAVGLGEPYALIISSHWLEHFRDDELTFMVARELGHIAAGHTRYTSLLSANGNENPIVSLIFGAWLRRLELTCDRIGLLCCGSLEGATRAISIATFHAFGRKIDHRSFADQSREIASEPVLRLGEWLGSSPYATRRIEAMRAFMQSPLYGAHQERFAHEHGPPPALAETGRAQVVRKDCAGWWRRLGAFVVDFIVVAAIVQLIFHGQAAQVQTTQSSPAVVAKAASSSETLFNIGGVAIRAGPQGFSYNVGQQIRNKATNAFMPLWLCIYFVLLVGIVGQTPGMMITGLRVVRTDFHRPSAWQTIWRYVVAGLLWWLIMPLSLFSRVYLHDRLSGTRLIKSERALMHADAGLAHAAA